MVRLFVVLIRIFSGDGRSHHVPYVSLRMSVRVSPSVRASVRHAILTHLETEFGDVTLGYR